MEENRISAVNGARGGQPEHHPQIEPAFDLLQVFDLLRRRWWVIGIFGLIGLAIGWGIVRRQPDVYSAQVVLERKVDQSPLESLGGLAGRRPVETASQIQIIQSRAVLTPVVDSLGLRVAFDQPEFLAAIDQVIVTPTAARTRYTLQRIGSQAVLKNAAGDKTRARAGQGGWLRTPALQLHVADVAALSEDPMEIAVLDLVQAYRRVRAHLTIETIRETSMLRLGYEDVEPTRAATIVNAIANSYRAHMTEAERREASQRRELILRQMASVADSLKGAQTSLADFQERSGSLDPKVEGSALAAALLAVENDVRNLRFQEGMVESLLTALRANDSQGVQRLIALGSEILPGGAELYHRLQELQAQRTQLTAAGMTSAGPRVQVLDSAIIATKQETRAVAEQGLNVLRQRLRAAEQRMDELRIQVGGVPTRATAQNRFEQRVDVTQRTFDMLAEKYYEAQIAAGMESSNINIVDPAIPPNAPDPRREKVLWLLSLLLGLIVGIFAARLVEFIDSGVRNVTDAERASGVHILGQVPMFTPNKNGGLLVASGNKQRGSEAFLALRSTLRFATADRMRVMAVTSPGPGDGKSLTAANLALSFALQSPRVLLVDADLHRPTIHNIFELAPLPGLTDLIVGEAAPHEVVRQIPNTNLSVVPCGTRSKVPSDLLSSVRFRKCLAEWHEQFDMVIVDTPPVLAVADVLVLAPLMDSILLVVRANSTNRYALRQAVAQLTNVSETPLFGLLNAVPMRKGFTRYGGYYSGYYYVNYDYSHNNGDGATVSHRRSSGVAAHSSRQTTE